MFELINIDSWLGFTGSIIGAAIGLLGIWYQIKVSEKMKIKNIKRYILEIINWNLNKIENEEIELYLLNSLHFEVDWAFLNKKSLNRFLNFDVNENLETKAITIELGLAFKIREVNISINLFNDLLDQIEDSNNGKDLFYKLKLNVQDRYSFIKKISRDISNWIYYIRTNKRFGHLVESENFLNEMINYSNEDIDKYCMSKGIINKLKYYKENENFNIDFVKILYQILVANLRILDYDSSKEEEKRASIFLRKKALEIEYMVDFIPKFSKEINELQKILKKIN